MEEKARMLNNTLSVEHVAAPIRDQVLTNLRKAIVGLQLQPGQRLIERELVEMTGASRTSVREALRQLAAEGLVETVPHKGTVVASPGIHEAGELYDVRELLEALIVRRFTEVASDSEIEELRSCYESVAKAGSLAEILRAKEEFYDVLGKKTPTVYSILSTLRDRVSVLRALTLSEPTRTNDAVREIYELVEAISERDADRASLLSAQHVQHAKTVALNAIAARGVTTVDLDGQPDRASV